MNDIYQHTREYLAQWNNDLSKNILLDDGDLQHSLNIFFKNEAEFLSQIKNFANTVATKLEPVVNENNLNENLPSLQQYDAIGNCVNEVKHHPSYIAAGNLIYGSNITAFLAQTGQLSQGLALLLLSSHAGEAGHNCPIACSAGVIRILNSFETISNREFYLEMLTRPSF